MQSEISTRLAAARRHSRSMDSCRHLKMQAMLFDKWRYIRGEATDLLCFEDIIKGSTQQNTARRVQEVALRQIIGSVGRSRDFTRDFLPRQTINLERWTRIHLAFVRHEPLPLVELYQVGDIYCVVDGHHRISVARALGFKEIDAYVMQVHSASSTVEAVRKQSSTLFQRFISHLSERLVIYSEHLKTFAQTM